MAVKLAEGTIKLAEFNEKHPNLVKIGKTGIAICVNGISTTLSNSKSSKKSNKKISHSKEKNTVYNNVEKEKIICDKIKDYEKNKDDFEIDDRENTVPVQGYERTYKKTGKTVQCSPYTRRPPRKKGN